jgi:2-polyprenyl-3-methyl-5-hydroxy-6-metoxy-1,4-benzoquinol methylase
MSEFSVQPCTVCGSKQSTFLFEKQSDGRGLGSISVYRCQACKAVYLGRYDVGYVDDLYEYYRQYQGKPKDALFSPQTARSYYRVLELFTLHISGKSILDVGCGNGDFVDAGLRAGWDINGIELAQPAVEIAQSFGLPVKRLDFFSDAIRPASHDIVTTFEVLEHLPDPINFLRRAADVVKPGGLVYLTTPNFDCFDRRFLGTAWPVIHREHLTYFTPQILISAIREKTGLTVIHSETRNVSVQSLQRIKSLLPGRKKPSNTSPQSVAQGKKAFDVRDTIEGSRVLQFVKRGVNGVLNATSSGNTIVLLLKRPA